MEKNTNNEMNIYQALFMAQDAIGAVGKDGQNAYDKYAYRTIDDVMNAVHHAFVCSGITAVPEVLDMQQTERTSKRGDTMIHTTLTVRYTLYAMDGSNVAAVVKGEGMDRGDKSINKAMSAAYKYAMFQILAIPTKEMIDSETESPEIAQEPQQKQQKKKKEEKAAEPETEEILLKKSELLGQVIELAKQKGISMADLARMSKTDSIATLPVERLERCVKYLETYEPAKSEDDAMFAAAEKAGEAA